MSSDFSVNGDDQQWRDRENESLLASYHSGKEEEEEEALAEDLVDHSGYAIWVILLNIGLNFALYGFQTVWTKYFTLPGIGFSKSFAAVMTNLLVFAVYFFALLGGFLADTFWGLYRMILIGTAILLGGSIIVLIGNVLDVAGYGGQLLWSSLLGVILFVLGSGLTKACTSAFLGDQFGHWQNEKRSQYYSWYYMSIQFGSIAITVVAPILLEEAGWGRWTLFTIITASVLLAFPFFIIPNKGFNKRDPQGSVYATFARIWCTACCWKCCKGRHKDIHLPSPPASYDDITGGKPHWVDRAKAVYDEDEVEDVKTALKVLLVFVPLPFFWAVFFQMYSLWQLQAGQMNRMLGSLEIPAATTTSLNPIFDIVLIPVFAKLVYPAMKKCGLELTPLRKIAIGHMFTIGALVVAAVIQLQIDESLRVGGSLAPTVKPGTMMTTVAQSTVSIWWIVPQYFLVSVGEILLAVTIYEFAYTQAPKTMKGMMTGFMMMTVAAGNAALALLNLIQWNRAYQNFALAGAVAIILVIFLIIAYNYEYTDEEGEGEDEEEDDFD